MTAKITLLQEDINQLAVDALVRCQYSSVSKLTEITLADISRSPDAAWQAQNMLQLDIPLNAQSPVSKDALIAQAYRRAFEFADGADIRSIALNVLGPENSNEVMSASMEHCGLAIRCVSEASIRYNNLRKIILCARDEQEYQYLVSALQSVQLH
ncbi:hypothetical protein KO519_11930 [Paraglaciecola agarilytica]|jgi:O-acetyl-ADP-ribose deacetylase (regulator of RNase III)|uniref:Uncharacterized protein n=1 Tax=Paraglaciecola chathamensis TaxID=368405 RepID=A0ABS0WD03_9ALTE|nr:MULTISPECIES: hypothetical protein [Paraglaciecola]MBJ2136352.1 hypothetical protein [Paraglaciecola chathamensis]MBU3018393.1 hypothetical protein [Paraglaciecola agarilytica]|tara:strand:- start:1083 stop:1547 length:465 start_codon:yes stop_codon:yes gene_type:complete